jgi:hypothetical protein
MRPPDENLRRVAAVLGLRVAKEQVTGRSPFTPHVVGTYVLAGRGKPRVVELSHGDMGGTPVYGLSVQPEDERYRSMAFSDINEVLDYLLVLCGIKN